MEVRRTGAQKSDVFICITLYGNDGIRVHFTNQFASPAEPVRISLTLNVFLRDFEPPHRSTGCEDMLYRFVRVCFFGG